MQAPHDRAVQEHYGRQNLGGSILAAYAAAGRDPESLTQEDLASCDQFHIRGHEATHVMAAAAGLAPGTRVLDVGSGVGGPARTLATEFGCEVVGLDLVEEYCDAAALLTEAVGLADRVTFKQGSATDMPFADESFDVVWSQHIMMNIEKKERVAAEVARVLQPDGRYAVYEIYAGPNAPPHYPAPWAGEESISFLVTPEETRATLAAAGFQETLWRDVTIESRDWFRERAREAANRPADALPPLGLNLIMGPSAPTRLANVLRSLEEDRLRVVEAVLTRV